MFFTLFYNLPFLVKQPSQGVSSKRLVMACVFPLPGWSADERGGGAVGGDVMGAGGAIFFPVYGIKADK